MNKNFSSVEVFPKSKIVSLLSESGLFVEYIIPADGYVGFVLSEDDNAIHFDVITKIEETFNVTGFISMHGERMAIVLKSLKNG